MIDASHSWFKPLWRRVLISILCIGWSGFELYTGNSGWAMLFFAMGVWALFLHRGKNAERGDPADTNGKDGP